MRTDWEVKTLGEVLKIQNGYAFDSKLFSSADGTQLIRIRDLKNGLVTETKFSGSYDKKYEVKSGDFLIGMDGEFGCYEWKGTISLLNQRVCRLESFSKRLFPRFLFYGINSYLKAIEDVTAFATVKHLSSKQIEGIEIPLPPLLEQQRIVAILDEAFAAIDKAKANAETNLQNARALFDSYLQSVFANPGEGWDATNLGAEIDLLAGFAFKSNRYTESTDDIRLLRGDNIMQGSLRWEDVKRWPSSETSEYNRYQLHDGDIVLAMDRPWVKAGLKYASITESDLPSLLVQRTARLRVGRDLDRRFLSFLIGSGDFTKHIIGVQSGIGVPHISAQQIKDFEFLRPSLPEQQFIVTKLDTLFAETKKLETIYRQKLTDLDELKKAILQKAFRGELSKTQGVPLCD